MPDRENVIKELEGLRDICNAKSNMAIGKGKIAWAGYANAVDDALVLLKEQEAVKPLMAITGWACGRCGHLIAKDNERLPDRCDVCGTRVGGLV